MSSSKLKLRRNLWFTQSDYTPPLLLLHSWRIICLKQGKNLGSLDGFFLCSYSSPQAPAIANLRARIRNYSGMDINYQNSMSTITAVSKKHLEILSFYSLISFCLFYKELEHFPSKNKHPKKERKKTHKLQGNTLI